MDTAQCDTVAVFTARSPERIIREGGSQSWRLTPSTVRQFKYVIAVQNQHNPDRNFSDATEPHGSAFLIGKISGVVKSPEDPEGRRYLIQISDYARIAAPNFWDGNRYPVRYLKLADTDSGIDPARLKWTPMPARASTVEKPADVLAAARNLIATAYNVPPTSVEITVRL
jgi:hypothetical protein